ncbi:ABC transporter ATP-binding protein [Isobaculum melis]|uniref:Putative ABC transport system ATP-binding protein n=1 Tax=Isobaculum melis TaxID=142588 RepID=A0A1H9TRG0_9LACT|nr:ABC transporter ATP-binding protein [Isobaculum melis]SER99598.1 putative ABC transport system ATP-binding protein [Isobaculum melis]
MLIAKNLSYKYQATEVLSNINLSFESGKMYAIIGKSGSGKTTLLSLLSGINATQQGTVILDDKTIKGGQLRAYRRNNSIVFQAYNLINYLTPLQNVKLALEITGNKGNHTQIAKDYLQKVGLNDVQMKRKCTELSGGQQQRVAIARAIACQSKIVFADEPTGNLDSATGEAIIQLLKNLAKEENKCVICVTHDAQLENYADEVIHISDGKIT